MYLNQDNSEDRSSVGFNKNVQLLGLDDFIKNLEKHFFSSVTVRGLFATPFKANLVIELDCNFGLQEALRHFNSTTWGNFKSLQNSFLGSLKQFKQRNDLDIVIEEFSLFLSDTSIIINKIYDQSIPEQLEIVFQKLHEHAIYYTKGFIDIPYEIYIPVFEDRSILENEHALLMNINSGNSKEQDYYSFWGLYHHSEEDAVVYDLKNQTTIRGKLQMLNR